MHTRATVKVCKPRRVRVTLGLSVPVYIPVHYLGGVDAYNNSQLHPGHSSVLISARNEYGGVCVKYYNKIDIMA